MLHQVLKIFLTSCVVTYGVAQISPNYVCVPAGTCQNNNTNAIDPRIVIANQNQCPPGQVPCYTGPGSQCGLRYVSNISTADGIATYGAYPWQVYIENQTGFTGAGVLIDQYHVLTAAHKVLLNVNTPSNIRLSLGLWDTSNRATTQTRTAASIRLFAANFNPSTLRDDLAIIRMNAPITLGSQSSIGTACLPTPGQSFVGQTCTVSGWGQTNWSARDAPTRYLKQASVPIVSYPVCRESMRQRLNNVDMFLDPQGEICAGGQAGIDACTQDGGSPLICNSAGRFTAVGLVIWGKQCGLANVYGVYVSLSNPAYRTWIDQTVAQLNAG